MMTEHEIEQRDSQRNLNQELLGDLAVLRTGNVNLRTFEVDVPMIVGARHAMGLSQREFSRILNVSVRTLQDWEQGRRSPTGPAQSLIKIAIKRPEVLKEIFVSYP